MSPATFYTPSASPYATTFFSHECASLSRLLFNLKRDVYVSFINFYSPAVSPPSSLLSCGASVSGAAVSGSGAFVSTTFFVVGACVFGGFVFGGLVSGASVSGASVSGAAVCGA